MSISGLLATGTVVLIMALVGYVLSRLAQPDTHRSNRAGEISSSNNNANKDNDAAHVEQTNATGANGEHSYQTILAQSDDTTELPDEQLIETVNRLLPQTQCAQCGHPGCRPYATAIIKDNAPINQCPPGGDALIAELANLLGTDVLPLDDDKGQTKPPQVAFIVEQDCIGCVLCIAACPVDAIVGAARYMHTVIADQCTGCELCLPPCPVDCIELHPVDTPLHRWQWPKPS